MKKTIHQILALGFIVAFLPSCTGDPASGGVFWSPTKFVHEQRNPLENKIRATNTDTYQKNQRADYLQGQIKGKRVVRAVRITEEGHGRRAGRDGQSPVNPVELRQ